MLPSKVMPAPTSKKRRATTTQRTRKTFDNVCILFCCIVVVALVFYCSGSSTHTTLVNAKEIEATHEWTLIGENDTIAAGMHVKMDMTTGEKWVKLMDEKDQKSQSETMSLGGGAGSSSSSTEGGDGGALVVQIDANGNVKTNNNNELYDQRLRVCGNYFLNSRRFHIQAKDFIRVSSSLLPIPPSASSKGS